MFSIGEFSKVTGLTVKTLRFYHEQGLLIPSYIDEQTGYRYYTENKIEIARVIKRLRELEFSVADVCEILSSHSDEADILESLEQHRRAMQEKQRKYREIGRLLDQIIRKEREARSVMTSSSFEVEEKMLTPLLVAGVRMKGKYSDCGKGFARIGKTFGRHICGKPFLLHYDTEYRERDADFEACMPIRKGSSTNGITVHELTGGRCVSLLHSGPYVELGRSYAKILSYVNQHGLEIEVPTREIYVKGPGMIFRGNPEKYVTEIQMILRKQ